jgi:hypothetical protein
MREREIGAVENIHSALPYIQVAPILALVGVGVNRIGKEKTNASLSPREVPVIVLVINRRSGLPRLQFRGDRRSLSNSQGRTVERN